MKIKLLGICKMCGLNLCGNMHGKTFCPMCGVNDAVNKLNKFKEQIAEKDISDKKKGNEYMNIFLLFAILLFCGCLKKPLITVEPTLLKANEDVNLLKNQIDSFKGDVSGLKGDIGKVLEANVSLQGQIKATLEANTKAIAGFQNQIQETKTTAGRDVVQTATTTNETSLMKYIIQGLIGLCTTLIGILGWCLKTLIKRDKEKKFYKEETFLHIQTEVEKEKLRERHDKIVNGGRK